MLPTAIWPSSRALEDLTMPQFARLLVFVPLIAVGLAHAQSADFSTLNCWGGETPEQCAVPRVPMLRSDSIDGMMENTYTQRQSTRTLGANVAKDAGHYVSLSDRSL